MAVDPDTYLFWDDLHPTTHGHNILATAADKLLTQKKSGWTSLPNVGSLPGIKAGCSGEFACEPAGAVH